MSKKFDPVKRPKHYNSHPSGIEPIVFLRWMGFNVGNSMKYLWRNGLKDGNPKIQDIKKAIWYLEDEVKRLESMEKKNAKRR